MTRFDRAFAKYNLCYVFWPNFGFSCKVSYLPILYSTFTLFLLLSSFSSNVPFMISWFWCCKHHSRVIFNEIDLHEISDQICRFLKICALLVNIRKSALFLATRDWGNENLSFVISAKAHISASQLGSQAVLFCLPKNGKKTCWCFEKPFSCSVVLVGGGVVKDNPWSVDQRPETHPQICDHIDNIFISSFLSQIVSKFSKFSSRPKSSSSQSFWSIWSSSPW